MAGFNHNWSFRNFPAFWMNGFMYFDGEAVKHTVFMMKLGSLYNIRDLKKCGLFSCMWWTQMHLCVCWLCLRSCIDVSCEMWVNKRLSDSSLGSSWSEKDQPCWNLVLCPVTLCGVIYKCSFSLTVTSEAAFGANIHMCPCQTFWPPWQSSPFSEVPSEQLPTPPR